ncbi:hypothetical protein RHSIM_Rhsim02G0247500 [Rhododendron simsii]|uniref:3-oxoacyl-[acyl-carrier-protein] synthase I, chloroplastic n=1 Tax=Rhododendron simsii TaxID=118357 RepID=A0A834HMT6_RHOSS|nr:hypothetical protein RHSIM_Rhsim02G0247500 [Rhododendron simsii]
MQPPFFQLLLEEAGVSPEEVNYVNAHATSTLAGDLAEINALKMVFKNTSEMKMNGTKSMTGLALGAAGGLEAIATIKAINTGWLHPTINQYNLESDVTIDTVPNAKKEHEVHVEREMAAIAGGTGCSAGLVFKNKESSCSNGVSVLHFNGIRAVENKQVGSSGFKPNGFISTSGLSIMDVLNSSGLHQDQAVPSLLLLPPNDQIVPSRGHDIALAGSKFRRIKAVSSPTVSPPKREMDPKKRIVITGMGVVSVFGNDIDTFYDKLLEGQSGITPIDRFDASAFSVRIAGQIHNFSCEGYINGKNDRRLDDCWRYCLVAGKKALVEANLGPEVLETVNQALPKFLTSVLQMDKSKIGVLVGSSLGGLTAFSSGVEALIQSGHKKISPFLVPYIIPNMGSALLAIDTGLMGPSYCISTACATANHCFFAAAGHIRRGEANIMVAGATEAAVTPVGVGGFIACRVLSQRNSEPHKASRPWDKERDGFVLGEGSGVLIMESLEHATKRGANIIAEYLGGAVTCDAYHMTDPRKDGLGVSSCVRRALEEAGVSPEEVNYVNAHATSTPAGDLAEVNALKKVFKNTSEMKMNGTKVRKPKFNSAYTQFRVTSAFLSFYLSKYQATVIEC